MPSPEKSKIVEAQEAILDQLKARIGSSTANGGREVLNLAEAYAWLAAPSQPHGGGSGAPKS